MSKIYGMSFWGSARTGGVASFPLRSSKLWSCTSLSANESGERFRSRKFRGEEVDAKRGTNRR